MMTLPERTRCSGEAAPALGVRYLIGNIGLPIYATQHCDFASRDFDLSQSQNLINKYTGE
jgi:hypothetical protein